MTSSGLRTFMQDELINKYLSTGLVILSSDTIGNLAKLLAENKKQIVYIVDNHKFKRCIGSVSYGDFIRWITNHNNGWDSIIADQQDLVNKHFRYVKNGVSDETITELVERFGSIPMLNSDKTIQKIVYSKRFNNQLIIDNKLVSPNTLPFYIAEIGNNHNGKIDIARELVKKAKSAGADAVKFQLRTKVLYGSQETDLGTEYVNELVDRFSLEPEQLDKLAVYARAIGLKTIVTPFDRPAVQYLDTGNWDAIKIASVDLVNKELIQDVKKLSLPIILSTGMSVERNIQEAYELVSDHPQGFCFLHCNSTYPSPYEDIHLEFINTLKQLVGPIVGYSGHEIGFHVANAALVFGACVIEKHFTLDKSMIGNDHKVSLLPSEFEEMVQKGNQIFKSIGKNKGPSRHVSQGEMINKKSLGKGYSYNDDLTAGTTITANDISQIPSSDGVSPEHIHEFIGRPLANSVKKSALLQESDFKYQKKSIRPNINSTFGVPVRFHDVTKAVEVTQPKFVEYHLSYSDLSRIEAIKQLPNFDVPFSVHSPEQYADDFIINFADKSAHEKSFALLDQVFNLTQMLRAKHPSGILCDGKIPVILNVGGFSLKEPMNRDEKLLRLETVCDALAQLRIPKSIKLLCQTMPPYPWLYGGSAFHNILTELDDVKRICCINPNIGVCLDVAHTAMWLISSGQTMTSALKEYFAYADYLHIADVENERSEGLQIGHGIIDFENLRENLLNKQVPWVTEIWMGHSNNFTGCSLSLEKLQQLGW